MSDKTYAERFGTPSRPDGCPVLIAAALTKVETENAALKIERNRLRVVLQDIADASGFDNIGKWARNKAKDALRKEAQP